MLEEIKKNIEIDIDNLLESTNINIDELLAGYEERASLLDKYDKLINHTLDEYRDLIQKREKF